MSALPTSVHIIKGRNRRMNFGVFGTKRTVYYREVSSRMGSTVYINSLPRWMLFQLIVTYESLSGRDCSCQRPRACPKTPNKRCEIITNFISMLYAEDFALSVKEICFLIIYQNSNGGNCHETERNMKKMLKSLKEGINNRQ